METTDVFGTKSAMATPVKAGPTKSSSSSRSMKSYRDMSYREKPATPNSPSGTSVTTMYDHLLSPSSPNEPEEKDDRLKNDLLDEICNDMGIDDSMDLDFDDLCYTNQQKQAAAAAAAAASQAPYVRFLATPSKVPVTCSSSSGSVVASSSGYATSDSLCAMAKLTQSISTEPGSRAEADTMSETGSQGTVKSNQASEIKDEPYDGTNDTDQGKVHKLRENEKRRREVAEQSQPTNHEAGSACQSANQDGGSACALNSDPAVSQASTTSVPGNWQNSFGPTHAPASRSGQPCLDYSYPHDCPMDDATEPDTMINFSEMPQQPNYYQLPQTAQDTMNLNFSMSLQHQSGSASQPFLPPSAAAPASLPSHPNPFQRSQSYAGQQQMETGSITGRMSPHHTAFRSLAVKPNYQQPQHQPPGRSAFGPCSQGGGAPGSIQPSTQAQASMSYPPTPSASKQPVSQTTNPVQTTASPIPGSGAPAVQATTASISGSGSFNSQQGFMQRLVDDKSSAFRSHPLFPLLRDLIIADMNFHEPTFPHQLIRDLPSDFNKLLKNYLSRNPPWGSYQSNQSVESVVMDALKYAHHTLIEKIQQKKSAEQSAPPAGGPGDQSQTSTPALNNVNEYCVKFEASVRENMAQAEGSEYGRQPAYRSSRARTETQSMYSGIPGFNQPLSVETAHLPSPSAERTSSMYPPQPQHQYPQPPSLQNAYNRSVSMPNARNPYMNPHGSAIPPPNYTVSPNNPPLPRHQQSVYEMGQNGIYAHPEVSSGMASYGAGHDPYNSCMPPPSLHRMHPMNPIDRHLTYMNNINDGSLVKTVMEGGKDMYCDMPDSMSVHSMQGSTKGGQAGKQTEGRKHASLPKEAVNIMLNWLREHQDKPYPNDDEKGMLIKQTGLSITQINYWFTNARRRLLPKWRGEDP